MWEKESVTIEGLKEYWRNLDENENKLDSYFLALAGLYKYNSGVELEEILPLYLKKPQAQRLLEEKSET